LKYQAVQTIEDRLGCEGYFGFGGGWAMVNVIVKHGNALYCNRCPKGQSCWTAHKKRVALLVPGLTAEFERRAQKMQGPELVRAWFDEFKCTDPYTTVMGGNIEDGILVAMEGKPKDRGENTLPWPFNQQQ